MFNGQMELGLGSAKVCRSRQRREIRRARAQWWFERMRQVVDLAMDRRPAKASPEQMLFVGAYRAPMAGGHSVPKTRRRHPKAGAQLNRA